MIALSWSRWDDFAQCPRKFYLKYIEKSFPPFDSKALHLVRGENMHKQLENYVDHLLDPKETPEPSMQPETAALKDKLQMLHKTSVSLRPESQISVDQNWQQVDWFAKTTVWRAIMDLIALRSDHAIIWDYKSGKHKPYSGSVEEPGQLHLSAAMMLHMVPKLDYVETAYLFLDAKIPESVTVSRSDGIKVKQVFDRRFIRVQEEREWAPKKNQYCNWCEATQAQCKNSKKMG